MSPIETENKTLKEENFLLKAENAQLKKMLFSAKRERFISGDNPNQGQLFDDQALEAEPVEKEEVISQKKKPKKARPPIQRNTFSASLRREEEVIQPDGVDLGKHAVNRMFSCSP